MSHLPPAAYFLTAHMPSVSVCIYLCSSVPTVLPGYYHYYNPCHHQREEDLMDALMNATVNLNTDAEEFQRTANLNAASTMRAGGKLP